MSNISIDNCQAILFDFDGLILDTETTIFQAWQEMFRKHHQELLLEEWAEILGKSEVDFVSRNTHELPQFGQ